MNEELKKYG